MSLGTTRLRRWSLLAFIAFIAFFTPDSVTAQSIHHYVFFDRARERIAETSFLMTKAFEGAQLKYTWRELEPERDQYRFSDIRKDLEFLREHGKRMFIQLQDVSFDTSVVNVPMYLLRDTLFHSGADMKFETDKGGRIVPDGWVARRWDPAVQERLRKLFKALGEEFDGRIEGINLPETSISFGENPTSFPRGFTPGVYRDAVITNMKTLKKAFGSSVTMLYANFMPGEWLPMEDHSYLRSVVRTAKEIGMGLGGPDLLPYKKGQMNHAYKFMRECREVVPMGIAAQDGNYDYINPQTNHRVTIPEMLQFAEVFLGARYLFWCTEEPYYSRDLIPLMKSMR